MVTDCKQIMDSYDLFIYTATVIFLGLADASWLISGLRSLHKDKFNGLSAIFTNIALWFSWFGELDYSTSFWIRWIEVGLFSCFGLTLVIHFSILIKNIRYKK